MSAQQNRPNSRGGRGRGGHPGQNRGGYSGPRRGGPQGNAPIPPAQQQGQQFQPTFPTPHSAFNASPPYHVPPPCNPAGLPTTSAKTVREETTITYTEGGKTVTTVMTVVNEVGHAPEYGHQPFTPNSQFHVNTSQPLYQGEYQNTIPPQQGTGKQRPPMSQPMPKNPPYNERPVSGRPQGSRGPPMSQPMPQNPPYNERPVSGRPQGSRGGYPRGRGKNNPSNQGARQQPRTSLADIAIDDEDDTEDQTQAQGAEKNQKKPKGKKKSQTQNEESMNSETPQPEHPRKTSESSETSAGESGPNVQAVFDFMVKELNGKGSPEEIRTKSGLFPMFDLAMVRTMVPALQIQKHCTRWPCYCCFSLRS